MKQLNRYEVLTRAANGLVTVKEAAEAPGISERQTKRLKKGEGRWRRRDDGQDVSGQHEQKQNVFFLAE
ncbi:MAG: hypothetical protein LBG71_07215 [Clostridiales Family XIII bacterium]|jgi:hypothetical protein|nr:hypothetical protein [Clostridiales Family XIII bacterium]